MKLKAITRRAVEIVKTEGFLPLVRKGLVLISHYLFTYNEHYLYECNIPKMGGNSFAPKINCTYRIVSTNQQVDELMSEGFNIIDHITDFADMRQRVNKGVMAVCIIVDHELAHITWVAMTQKAKDAMDELPYYVDFLNNEVCIGGILTAPKYRRRGLAIYSRYIATQYLNQLGKTTMRTKVNSDNIASQIFVDKFGERIYAKAQYLRILWWRFWREKPLV